MKLFNLTLVIRSSISILCLFLMLSESKAQDSLTTKSMSDVIQVQPQNQIISFKDGKQSIIKVMTTGSFHGYNTLLSVESSESKITRGKWDSTPGAKYRIFIVNAKLGLNENPHILKVGVYINEPEKTMYVPSKIESSKPLYDSDSKVIYSNAKWKKVKLNNYYIGEMEFIIRSH